MKTKFLFSLLGLFLMISGFFVQQAAKISFVEHLVAPDAADARLGLEDPPRKGRIIPTRYRV
jgi:hypothetical protein